MWPPPDRAFRAAAGGGAACTPDRGRAGGGRLRLFREEGLLHFDLFAESAAELLHRSPPLAEIISSAYPVIILDEFQDTNPAEWRLMQALGKWSTLIALADPDQRIYEFRGADPGAFRNSSRRTSRRPLIFLRTTTAATEPTSWRSRTTS